MCPGCIKGLKWARQTGQQGTPRIAQEYSRNIKTEVVILLLHSCYIIGAPCLESPTYSLYCRGDADIFHVALGRTAKPDPRPFNGIQGKNSLAQGACMNYLGNPNLGSTLECNPESLDMMAEVPYPKEPIRTKQTLSRNRP